MCGSKVRYQNTQKWCECQLVSIWNACRYWGINSFPKIGTKEYRAECKKFHAINGSALTVAGAFKRYGIKRLSGKYDLKWVRRHLPVEFSIFYKHGYHSVLCVAVNKNKVLLANYADGRTCWLNWDKLLSMCNRKVKPDQFLPDKRSR